MGKKSEYNKFTHAVDDLLRIPHAEIKAKLEAEKAKKKVNKKAV
jgi:hypothetical protein